VLNKRHAVITGTSAGIGRAIAKRLLTDGWQVSGIDLAPATLAHPAFMPRCANLADTLTDDALSADLTTGLATGLSHPVDALIHAAGILRAGRLDELELTDGALMWHLHVAAATRLAQALVPGMRQQGWGRVIFIGSRVAHGMPGRGQYAATKAALIALARSWAAEVVADGVTVNVISPAATQTSMLTDPLRAASAPRLPPLGRLIQPSEVAALAAFLLSSEAAPITGQDIVVCAGASLPSNSP